MTYPIGYATHKAITHALDAYLDTHGIRIPEEVRQNFYLTASRTLHFNRDLRWRDSVENVYLVSTIEEYMEVLQLRSRIYEKMGYTLEFPDPIFGLNYDEYDTHSAILYTASHGRINGSCRVIFDVGTKLPIDKNYSLDYLREDGSKLAELSRLMIEKETKGLSQEFRWLTKGVFHVMRDNRYDILTSVMVKEHFRMYERFGGFRMEKELPVYGNLTTPFIITAWRVAEYSPFFKKVFLNH